MRLEILPVVGIGEVRPGDDLAAMIGDAAPWLADGDVLVVTSKIVSKAEGRLVELPADEPDRTRVRDGWVDAETTEVVAQRGPTRIARTRHGFVMAAAGIDNSNVESTRLVLLPVDPDRSARELRRALRARLGLDLAVIVSDTMGRPWRNGLTDVALGAAGIDPVHDYRGQYDRYGNELRLTQVAVVDELAGAGDLVKGKSEQVPVAVVRGYPWRAGPAAADPAVDPAAVTAAAVTAGGDGPGVRPLIRDLAQDLFTMGTAEARRAGLLAAATLPQAPPPDADIDDAATSLAVDAEAVRRAVRAVAGLVAAGTRIEQVSPQALATVVRAATVPAYPGFLHCRPPADAPTGAGAALVRFGADLHRLRAALAAEGIASAHLEAVATPEPAAAVLGLAPAQP
ncbi:coenzyme F420-0:L-glutamate ligase [Micromonospora sp. NBC_01813]|uniref:coenzyme F420-0:L-glutamate ligase n=1 Tax=Micromonospora sp. NBC_01813 TaxID=2975988 RepID=UPI002DDA6423|nr:coenzyme F420-0:L-glutamate ligase [Micromonospora sp. NBC_01813]WSA08389.1 coenzyme F420-0:L-glutamate ligase [Micromonospora sp. NBC_01813]